MRKAPKRKGYAGGGEIPKKPVKIDLNTWSPEMLAQAKKNADGAKSTNYEKTGGDAPHSIGREAVLGINPATGKQYTDFSEDISRYTYVSGNAGQRVFRSRDVAPYGKNDTPNPAYPNGTFQTYVEGLNNGKSSLYQVPTSTYLPNQPTQVIDPMKAGKIAPSVLNAGSYQSDLDKANQGTAPLGYKGGGLVKSLGYANGTGIGGVNNENTLDKYGNPISESQVNDAVSNTKNASTQEAALGVASQLGGLGGQYLTSKSLNDDGTIDQNKAALGGALSGGAKGLALGANPALMAATGGLSAPIGAGAGALIGGGMKYFGAKNINEDIAYGQKQAEYDKIRGEQQNKFQSALAQQMLAREEGMKDGGVVKGKGGPKSDSINAKVKAGSFVVPAENVSLLKANVKLPKKKANLNQSGGENIRLSDGEYLMSPEEKNEVIAELGEEFLESLAPNASHENESFREGGLTAAKAKIMLADRKDLTDKQRGYMGLIASGYKCGGMVKGYVDGGEVDGEDPLKKEKERLAQEKLANEKEGKYYKDLENLTEAGLKKLEARKEAEEDFKYWKDALDAAKKDYTKYQEELKSNPLQKSGIRDVPKNNQETLARKEKGRKEQDARLNNITKIENSYNKAGKKYTDAKDDKNFNTDGSFKDSQVTSTAKTPIVKETKKDIYSTTGANVEKKYPNEFANTGDGVKSTLGKGSNKTKIGTGDFVNSFNPTGETSDSVVPPMEVAKLKEQTGKDERYERDLAEAEALGLQKTKPRFTDAQKQDYLSKGLDATKQIGGLANYFLPYQQYKMGQRFLAESGDRPVNKIDQDFLNSVTTAQANAKFGYTPEEQALVNNANTQALRTGQNAAQNYSGGSGASALNITRQATNDYYNNNLKSALANKQLQMNKAAYADSMIAEKQNLNNQLFQNNLNAWNQEQVAGGNLVGSSIQNLIGANRLNKEVQFQNQYNENSNPWKNYSING